MTQSFDFEALATELSATARACGEIILEVYHSDFEVEEKSDASPVTVADQRSEARILPDLRRLTPDVPIVAEEDVAAHGAPDFDGKTFWLVDALDGTKEFIKRRGDFTVNIALVVDGVPRFGLIYAPVHNTLWLGWGTTALKSEGGQKLHPVSARKLASPAVVLGSKSHAVKDKMDAFLAQHPNADFKAYGSSLKFCAVAEGTADLYPRFGPTCEWDTGAGHAIVLAAGGSVDDFDGAPLAYKKPDFLNGPFLVRAKAETTVAILAPTDENIRAIGANLKAGGVAAVPTETVYGLAADATNPEAVASIFRLKGRPEVNPLICHVADEASAKALGQWTPLAAKLAAAFWPGPLTLVLKRAPGCAAVDAVSAGLPTIAIRRPSHEVMEAVLAAAGVPLAAPSANPSGRLSPTRAEHVAALMDIPILDGGACQTGLESTVVDATGATPVILREGGVTREAISAVTGAVKMTSGSADAPTSPGQLLGHYAPQKAVRLNVTEKLKDEVLIGFGPTEQADLNLSAGGDLDEAATHLFDCLHQADRLPGRAIAIAPIPETGIGAAINDRLRRAAQSPT